MWKNKMLEWYNRLARRMGKSQIVYILFVHPRTRKGMNLWSAMLERDTSIQKLAVSSLQKIVEQPIILNPQQYGTKDEN